MIKQVYICDECGAEHIASVNSGWYIINDLLARDEKEVRVSKPPSITVLYETETLVCGKNCLAKRLESIL